MLGAILFGGVPLISIPLGAIAIATSTFVRSPDAFVTLRTERRDAMVDAARDVTVLRTSDKHISDLNTNDKSSIV